MKKFLLSYLLFFLLSACITAPAPLVIDPTAPRPTIALISTPELSSDIAFIDRPAKTIRVLSYNVNWDSIFPADDPQNHELREFDRQDSFVRIMRAIGPDVLCLQEINYLRSTQDLSNFLTEVIDDGHTWQVANVGDMVIATRFELIEEDYKIVIGSYIAALQQAAALVDLPDSVYGPTDLYLVCAHFKSGGSTEDILLRSRQADVIAAHIRDFETIGGDIDLPDQTPFVILGDFNAYDTDPALHLSTFIRGDIYDEDSYGEDFLPDWDASPLADLLLSHNGLEEVFYTWRNDAELFNPYPLDRIIFSDSVLAVQNAFILNTTLLSADPLNSLGLLPNDVILDPESGFYDHLPLVVDFALQPGQD